MYMMAEISEGAFEQKVSFCCRWCTDYSTKAPGCFKGCLKKKGQQLDRGITPAAVGIAVLLIPGGGVHQVSAGKNSRSTHGSQFDDGAVTFLHSRGGAAFYQIRRYGVDITWRDFVEAAAGKYTAQNCE